MIRGIGKVFINRWFALAWAIGVCVVAVSWIGFEPAANPAAAATNDDQPTDATGAPVDNQDVANLKNAVDSIG